MILPIVTSLITTRAVQTEGEPLLRVGPGRIEGAQSYCKEAHYAVGPHPHFAGAGADVEEEAHEPGALFFFFAQEELIKLTKIHT
jgi:hypothetical protein